MQSGLFRGNNSSYLSADHKIHKFSSSARIPIRPSYPKSTKCPSHSIYSFPNTTAGCTPGGAKSSIFINGLLILMKSFLPKKPLTTPRVSLSRELYSKYQETPTTNTNCSTLKAQRSNSLRRTQRQCPKSQTNPVEQGTIWASVINDESTRIKQLQRSLKEWIKSAPDEANKWTIESGIVFNLFSSNQSTPNYTRI